MAASGPRPPETAVLRSYGGPALPSARPTPATRFLHKIDMGGPVPPHNPDLGPCWLWIGALTTWGYGLFRVDARTLVGAHRYAFERAYGPLPPGFEPDHRCHDWRTCPAPEPRACPHRACVNPAHMRAVRRAGNNARTDSPTARNGRKTHCDADHELTEDNVYRPPGRENERHCRACLADARARYEARRRAARRAQHPAQLTLI